MYYFNRETEPFFGGVFETQGGGAGNGAEPGASGTTFLKHVVSGHSAIRVDNKNQTPAGDVIHNVGRELSLGGGKSTELGTFFRMVLSSQVRQVTIIIRRRCVVTILDNCLTIIQVQLSGLHLKVRESRLSSGRL